MLLDFDCERKLKQTRLGADFSLHPGFLCAGGEEGKDACKGDGGGPLACEVNTECYQSVTDYWTKHLHPLCLWQFVFRSMVGGCSRGLCPGASAAERGTSLVSMLR